MNTLSEVQTTTHLLSMREVAEIVGGRWLITPADDRDLVKHFALYSGELLKESEANCMIAMDTKTWQRGTGNRGIYANIFSDSHNRIARFRRLMKMAIVQRLIPGLEVPQLLVKDSYQAIVKLAQYAGAKHFSKNIGITGTVGKTTTKDLLAGMLAVKHSTAKTPFSHNSRTSTKITLINSLAAKYDVFEMAMAALWYGPNKVGVAQEVPMDLAMLTQVGVGQRGYDERQTADFKTRIAYGLGEGKPFLVNAEISNIDEVITLAHRYTQTIVTYGRHKTADFYGEVQDDHLKVYYQDQCLAEVMVPNFDQGLITNIIGAIAAYRLLTGTFDLKTADLMAICQREAIRNIREFTVNAHQVAVIDETHSAELLSMTNFINYANSYQTAPGTKKIFIAGRIVNLADKSLAMHRKLAMQLNQSQLDKIYTYGPEISQVADQFNREKFGGHFESLTALVKAVAAEFNQDTVVFIKGSHRNSEIGQAGWQLVRNSAYYATGADRLAISTLAPNAVAYTRNGVGRMLVILACLQRLTTGKLRLTDLVEVTQDLAGDASPNKIGLHRGDHWQLQTLLAVAIVAPAPDVIINLAEFVFGGNQAAVTGLKRQAKAMQLSENALINLTGRPTRQGHQRTFLSDLMKIGTAFTQLPNEFFSLLQAQRAALDPRGRVYQKRSQLLKTGKASGSLFFGVQETNGLFFYEKGGQRQMIAFINAPSVNYMDAKMEQLIDGGITAATTAAPNESITLKTPVINVLSDTYFGEMYTRARRHQKVDDALQKHGYHYSFEKLGRFFKPDDYNIFNFEGVFSDDGQSSLKGIKPFVLDADAEQTIPELKMRHLNLAMMANNHAKDCDAPALEKSLQQFQTAGFKTVGAGLNQLTSRQIMTFDYDGQKIALFNGYWYRNPAYNLFNFYAKYQEPGVNCLDTWVWEDVRAYKQAHPDTKIIVSAHWGADFQPILDPQRRTAQRLVEAGADLIIGHGPHILQPIEYVGKVPVIYSIGNGVFNNNGEFVKRHCLAYGATVRLNLAQRKLYLCPFYANNRETFWQPAFVKPADFDEARHEFGDQYATTTIDDDISAVVIPF
ncbi:hypothetical protein MH1LPH_03900 [Lactiplantibacillus brownii]